MKIHLTIEIEDGAKAPRIKVSQDAAPADKQPKLANIADAAPPPLTEEPPPETEPVARPGSGPQFDPGFLKVIQDIHEPFTRRSVAVDSGLKVEEVTQRFIRMHKKGWIEQPAPGLWRKTKSFGMKP